jgi:hypothetical protein
MHKARMGVILASLTAVALCLLLVAHGSAGATVPGNGAGAVQHQPLWTPVLVWRDCQRIARCMGCRPVYHCRSCSYQRTCRRDFCGWGDVCVWGPYLPLAPRGVPIY